MADKASGSESAPALVAPVSAPQAARVGSVSFEAPHGVFGGPGHATDTAIDQRMRAALIVANGDIATLDSVLLPAYIAARDTLNAQAAAQTGGLAVGVFTRICAAHTAEHSILACVPNERIVAAYRMSTTDRVTIGPRIPNPHYRSLK